MRMLLFWILLLQLVFFQVNSLKKQNKNECIKEGDFGLCIIKQGQQELKRVDSEKCELECEDYSKDFTGPYFNLMFCLQYICGNNLEIYSAVSGTFKQDNSELQKKYSEQEINFLKEIKYHRKYKAVARKVIYASFPYYSNHTKEVFIRKWLYKKYGSEMKYLNGNKQKSSLFRFHYAFKPNHINWKTYVPELQLVNHLRTVEFITNKAQMYKSFIFWQKEQEARYLEKSVKINFIPETYIINLKTNFISDEEIKLFNRENSSQWILKPSSGFGGAGIKLIQNISEFKEQLMGYKINYLSQEQKNGSKSKKQRDDWVLQKYISNPLLYDKKKFDYRFFVVIPCSEPLIAYFYPGFARKTVADYKMKIKDEVLNLEKTISQAEEEQKKLEELEKKRESESEKEDLQENIEEIIQNPEIKNQEQTISNNNENNKNENNKNENENNLDEYEEQWEADFSDPMSQISNVKIQREHPDYEVLKYDSVQSHENFIEYLHQKGFSVQQTGQMIEKMKEIAVQSIESLINRNKIEKIPFEYGQFQFLAFDIILDQKLKPYLIEINSSPSWVANHPQYAQLKQKLFFQTMDMVYYIYEKNSYEKRFKVIKNHHKFRLSEEFTLIYNQATEYSFKYSSEQEE